jgi:hypothetical protein
MASINDSGTYASFSITVLTIDSNTAYSADVCTLLEEGHVRCYEHVICVADMKHICIASLAVCVIGSWNSAIKLKYLKCSAFHSNLPRGTFLLHVHTYSLQKFCHSWKHLWKASFGVVCRLAVTLH